MFGKSLEKPAQFRWIGVNKGDDVSPGYRPKSVSKEARRDKRCGLFAATPFRSFKNKTVAGGYSTLWLDG